MLGMLPTANAYLCLSGYHYSQNYVFEITCDIDRSRDLVHKKTYNWACYKGLSYYYYCIKN